MMERKIVEVVEPDKESSLYIITYKDKETGVEYNSYLSKKSYMVVILEEKMLSKGYSPKLIEEFKDAVYDMALDDYND